MLARILSYALNGIKGYSVQVDVDVANGLPAYDTVGLPGQAVKESRERVRSAIKNSGLEFPALRITVNLAPADTRKEGPLYDLPIAIGILSATRQIQEQSTEGIVFFGELALNGDIRPVDGVLPMVIDACENGSDTFILPYDNAAEASYVANAKIYPAKTLNEVLELLNGSKSIARYPNRKWESAYDNTDEGDFAYIKGQQSAKRAIEIAASGGHNILFIGPPGSGKTLLARSLPSILPDMGFNEALEVTKIHSICGMMKKEKQGLLTKRPFCSPHHSTSTAALTGGGSLAKPGQISLSHLGILFLDEFPEFDRTVLEALRQPLEDGYITVSRVNATVTYPANFMLVASMNPCPCGNFGSEKPCKCSPVQISRYLGRLSSPLLDRIDLHIEMGAVTYSQITSTEEEEASSFVRKRVNTCRDIQTDRYKKEGFFNNAQLDARSINKYCVVDDGGKKLLKMAFESLGLSARAHSRVLKVARTIADMENSGEIRQEHIAEAIQYRSLDKKYWNAGR